MASDSRALVRRIQEQILSIDELRERRESGTLPPSTAFAASFLAEVMSWGTLTAADCPAQGDSGDELLPGGPLRDPGGADA